MTTTDQVVRDDVISGDIKWMDYQLALDRPITQIQDELMKALEEEFYERNDNY